MNDALRFKARFKASSTSSVLYLCSINLYNAGSSFTALSSQKNLFNSTLNQTTNEVVLNLGGIVNQNLSSISASFIDIEINFGVEASAKPGGSDIVTIIVELSKYDEAIPSETDTIQVNVDYIPMTAPTGVSIICIFYQLI
jgi:hypothetical protein